MVPVSRADRTAAARPRYGHCVSLHERIALLRSLHVPGRPLVLPNAWDAASAQAVVAAGFPVVATTSAGVAAALGYEDHQHAPPGEMLAAAARIARAVDVPVTVDAEAGYGLSSDELVDRLLEAGAAGCNFEDTDHAAGGMTDTARQAEKLAALRAAADARGLPLVVNARVDSFITDRDAPQLPRVAEAAERARAYLDAGADCVYPIFLHERDAIAAFVEAVPGPVNVFAVPIAPSIAELAELGVARISYGSLLHTRSMKQLAELLAAIPS
jgi:2-methylisocitrate lyase-like PEP mutase family enzyme